MRKSKFNEEQSRIELLRCHAHMDSTVGLFDQPIEVTI